MKRIGTFFFVLFILAVAMGLSNCKKQTADTSYARILGKWKKTQKAYDQNNDGLIEGNEISNESSGYSDLLYFNSDSAGTEVITVNGEPLPVQKFKWYLLYNDSLYLDYTAHDTISNYIVELNSSDLILSTTNITDSGSILSQSYYVKE